MAEQAWMVRGSQRQTLLEEIRTKLFRLEDDIPRPCVDYYMTHRLLDLLERRNPDWSVPDDKPPTVSETDERLGEFFDKEILRKITEFARAEEEANLLFAELLGKIVDSLRNVFYGPLQRKEMEDPETIFRARSATDEIEFDEPE